MRFIARKVPFWEVSGASQSLLTALPHRRLSGEVDEKINEVPDV